MFSLLNGMYDSYLAPTELNILVVGPSRVGKTTLLERMKVTQIPKRPGQVESPPEVLSLALHEAFVKGGADSPSEEQSSTTESIKIQTPTAKNPPSPPPIPQAVPKRRFNLSICPAPSRYSKRTEDQEEDYVVYEETQDNQEGKVNLSARDETTLPLLGSSTTTPTRGRTHSKTRTRTRTHSKELRMKDLDLSIGETSGEEETRMASLESIPLDNQRESATASMTLTDEGGTPLLQAEFEECHLKPKSRMLPMSKIRPTIGSNLAKIEMYGTKCHFFDVGGKLQNLWERYYDDCDAVIFCWKLGDDPAPPALNCDDDEDEEPFDWSKQQEVLNQVRKAIPDDVPFLIFGHVFGNVNVDLVDRLYSTDVVLPHYHNNLTSLFCGSAKTGAGIPRALEWLVPLAKRQQKERVAARKKLGDEEKEV